MRVALDGVPVEGLRVVRAQGVFARLVGLLNHASLPADEALWLPGTGSIHTWGMHFSIDVVFVRRDGRVVRVVERCPPGRVLRGPVFAAGTLELADGAASRHGFVTGKSFSVLAD